jgi:membrane protease YdiL (CAAX protease family)
MINLISAWIPYVAVLIGIYVFRSAWLAILLYHAGVAVFLFIRKPAGFWIRMRTGFKTPWLIPGLIVCALAMPAVYFLWPWFAISENILPQWMAYYGLSGWAWLLLIPYFSIVHPILEEALWREIAPDRFTWICRQDLLFAGYHVLVLLQLMKSPWLVLVFIVLAGSSIFWRWSAQHFGGYGLSILTHAMADAAVVTAVFFLLDS